MTIDDLRAVADHRRRFVIPGEASVDTQNRQLADDGRVIS